MQCFFLPAQAKKASGKCPFLQAKIQTKTNVQDAILAQPMDVEDLAKLGRSKLVCPYYTARSAVPDAQLVLLPYSALLAQVSHTQASAWCVCCMSPSEEALPSRGAGMTGLADMKQMVSGSTWASCPSHSLVKKLPLLWK